MDSKYVAYQYMEIVIPCKPTSPNYEVELLREDTKEIIFSKDFDPKFGFTIFLNNLEAGGNFTCRLVDNITNFRNVFVEVQKGELSDYLDLEIIDVPENCAMNGKSLKLSCNVETNSINMISSKFLLPNGEEAKSNERMTVGPLKEYDNGFYTILYIHNALKTYDEGNYTCIAEDIYNISVTAIKTIKFTDNPIIQFDSSVSKIDVNLKEYEYTPIVFKFTFIACPDFTLEVVKDEVLIGKGDKFKKPNKHSLNINEDEIKFYITSPVVYDIGNYTFVMSNEGGIIKRNIELIINAGPKCTVKDVETVPGKEITFLCTCIAYPPADIQWSFKACNYEKNDDIEDYDVDECDDFMTINAQTSFISTNKYTQSSNITIIASESGEMECKGQNIINSSSDTAGLVINDMSGIFNLFGIDEHEKIAIGDEIKLVCRALPRNYTNTIQWHKNDKYIKDKNNIYIIKNNTKYSYGSILHFKGIQKENEGEYNCGVFDHNHEFHEITKHLKIYDAQYPSIISSFSQNKISKKIGENLKLDCIADGIPAPRIVWKKNGKLINFDRNATRVILNNMIMTLEFMALMQEDDGEYVCIAENRLGKASKPFKIHITSDHSNQTVLITLSIALIFALLFLLYAWFYNYRNKKLIAELKAAGLENFEEGNTECINPDINLHEQADLLPYDKNFEFPKNKLELKKQLGAGAFGIVIEAIATGIVVYEPETVVAVKMVKKQAGNEVIKALVSELKILIHLGQHLNIVNLLGAVTKDIAKRELMVIVEYCKYGNLQNYLVKNRSNFIDQIRNGRIAPVFKKDDSSEGSSSQCVDSPKHINMIIVDDKTNPKSNEHATSNNDTEERSSLCTSDLVCWAFQVARGMDYLSKMRIIHGDLAARNILLCDNNIVKICDFGLSKSIYKNDIYKRKGENMLPFKWLSLEAISDSIFSVYSDVWSYGIMLWEFFSLGNVPYPGMEANEKLFYKIREGYRMEKPEFATEDIHEIMINCWNVVPESRPLFKDLERRFSSLMGESVKNHYIVLNDKYMRANPRTDKGENSNYLEPILSPSADAPKPIFGQNKNHYVKQNVISISDSSKSDSQQMSQANDTNSIVLNSSSNIADLKHLNENNKNVEQQAKFQEELKLKLMKRNYSKNT
ncbi:vascular endothelial growth factor receptor 1-like [Chironomus tepperi]|uniref:vascular endothelial growth factor receptor 1-like n=1 Tax=Chironomus tepperi TaxID=113505 RepID=UPI00391FC64B